MGITKFRLLRSRKGESMVRFAIRLGINPGMLARFEKGQAYLPQKWWKPLAEDLGVEPEEFLDPETGFPLWGS